jgi:phosphate transport system permease protein
MDQKKKNQNNICNRKLRPVEFIIELFIRSTAFLSLAFIVLIFVFVFREASSIFNPHKAISTASVGEAETYGEDVGTYGDEQETYGEEALGTENPETEENQDAFREIDESNTSFWDVFGAIWQPVSLIPKFGIWPLFLGSLKVALVSLLFGAPIAILAALYTSTFASARMKEIVKPAVELLAGFPSVVIGFFALMVLATLLQSVFGLQYRLNAFVGGIALSIAIIPVIYTISEDALNAVPRSFTEASLALGAEKWETAIYVVLPAAVPGIFAAVLLGIGRAIGETMIVLMATGNAAFANWGIFDPVRTMSATIGAEMAEVVFGDFHYGVLFFIGVLLFAISFIINLTSEVFVRRLVMRQFK